MGPTFPLVLISGASSAFREAVNGFLVLEQELPAAEVPWPGGEHPQGTSGPYESPSLIGLMDARRPERIERFARRLARTLGPFHVVAASAGQARGEEELKRAVSWAVGAIEATLPPYHLPGWSHMFLTGLPLEAVARVLRLELCGTPLRTAVGNHGLADLEFVIARVQGSDAQVRFSGRPRPAGFCREGKSRAGVSHG